MYKENQATIKRLLENRITNPVRQLDVLITTINDLHIHNTLDMLGTRSNIQFANINSKPHGRQSLRDIIDKTISVFFYTTLGSKHYNLLRLNRFHGYTHHQAQINHKPTKKCNILCIYFLVYNVNINDRAGKLHMKIHTSRHKEYVHLKTLHEKIPHIRLSRFYRYV